MAIGLKFRVNEGERCVVEMMMMTMVFKIVVNGLTRCLYYWPGWEIPHGL